MKKIYTKPQSLVINAAFALLASAGLHAQVNSFPWTETFENNSPTRAQWTQIYEVNNMSWTYAASPSTGGTGVTAYEGTLMANYPGTSHNFDKTKLVSPVLDLSGNASATLTFYYRNPYWNPDQNWLRIFYRTSDADAWVQIAEFHENITAWTSSGALNLPNLSSTYQIAVECETDYGYSTTVDALTVAAVPLSVAENRKLDVRFSPNPAGDVLYFSGNETITEVMIFNLLGQQVKAFAMDSDAGEINISGLQSGQYIVRASSDSRSDTFKLIKK